MAEEDEEEDVEQRSELESTRHLVGQKRSKPSQQLDQLNEAIKPAYKR